MSAGAMRGGMTPDKREAAQMGRISARQRRVVLTFATVADAEAFDAAPDEEALARLILEART